MGVGPIPVSSVHRFGREDLGLDPDACRLLWIVIHTMDSTYLEWQRDNTPKQDRGPTPPVQDASGKWSR